MNLVKKNGKKYRKDGDFLLAEDESHVIYRGVTFSWIENYYRCPTNLSYSNGLLHRVVWEDHFGSIPEGYHIHHKDANRRNNHIENLQCLEGRLHLSRSAKKSSWVGSQENLEALAAAREKGKQWHSTKEGLEWHRRHAKEINLGHIRVTFQRKCEQCGKEYQSQQKQGRFCSRKCKSNFRYYAGVDNENRTCVICKKYFTVNRYMSTKTCERACGVALWRISRALKKKVPNSLTS